MQYNRTLSSGLYILHHICSTVVIPTIIFLLFINQFYKIKLSFKREAFKTVKVKSATGSIRQSIREEIILKEILAKNSS